MRSSVAPTSERADCNRLIAASTLRRFSLLCCASWPLLSDGAGVDPCAAGAGDGAGLEHAVAGRCREPGRVAVERDRQGLVAGRLRLPADALELDAARGIDKRRLVRALATEQIAVRVVAAIRDRQQLRADAAQLLREAF